MRTQWCVVLSLVSAFVAWDFSSPAPGCCPTPPPGKPAGNVETGIALYTDHIDADHADLKANGVDVDAEVSRMGDPVPPLFWFRDPDGNTLMVVESR